MNYMNSKTLVNELGCSDIKNELLNVVTLSPNVEHQIPSPIKKILHARWGKVDGWRVWEESQINRKAEKGNATFCVVGVSNERISR